MTDSKAPLLLQVSWIQTSILIIAVALRFFTRFRVTRHVGIDDYVMLIAGICQVISQAFLTVSIHFGIGQHIAFVSPAYVGDAVKWSYANLTAGILASIIARVSITLLLCHIFGRKKWLKQYLYTVTSIQTAIELLVIISIWASCKPVSKLWNPTSPGQCWNPIYRKVFAYLGQSIFTLTDLSYVLLPISIVWTLKLRLKYKVGLFILLSFGLLTMVASIFRTIYVQEKNDRDPTYSAWKIILWSSTEQNLVVIMGCVPTLRPLLRFQDRFGIISTLGSYLSKLRSRKDSDCNLDEHSLEIREPPKRILGDKNARLDTTEATFRDQERLFDSMLTQGHGNHIRTSRDYLENYQSKDTVTASAYVEPPVTPRETV